MNICFVLPEYDSKLTGRSGGVGQLSARLASKLVERGHTVCVITRSHTLGSIKQEDENGVHILAFPHIYRVDWFLQKISGVFRRVGIVSMSRKLNSFLTMTVRKRYARFLKRIEKKYSVDIIETSDAFGCLSLYSGRTPICARLHASHTLLASRLADFNMPLNMEHFESESLKKAQCYIGVSETVIQDSANCFKSFPLLPLYLVYNGIDTSHFSPKSEPVLDTNKLFRMIFVANVHREKGYDFICELANILAETKLDFCIDIYGHGEAVWQEKYLPSLCNNALQSVEFHGGIENTKLVDAYRSADILLCPSWYESFGLTMVEAQASGLPVFANSFDAAAEIVEDQLSGYVIPIQDIDRWVQKIIELANDTELYQSMAISARERAVDKFSVERMTEESINVYSKIIQLNKQ